MLDRLMGAMIAITVVLASSSVAFAQNGKQATAKSQGAHSLKQGGLEQAF